MREILKKLLKKHNERMLLKSGLIHCAYCKKLISKGDKYCQYCGKPTETWSLQSRRKGEEGKS